MASSWRIRIPTAIVCLLVVFGLGIAAERYRRHWISNVGEVTVQRGEADIGVTIDGQRFTDWKRPVVLRAGSHEFLATRGELQVKLTVRVKRGDAALWNRVKFSVRGGQLQAEHNSQLVDVAPRPATESRMIQTALGRFWHVDNGQIVLRDPQQPGGADRFTIHWLRPDHSEAFIQASDGRFLTTGAPVADDEPASLRLCDNAERPSVFRVTSLLEGESWFELASGRSFVGVDTDGNRIQVTPHHLFASPHLFVVAKTGSSTTQATPPPAEIVAAQPAADSMRRLRGHEDVIRALVFTPDSKHLISGSSDGTIRFWNVANGKQVHSIPTHRPVMSLAISGDGSTLASGMVETVVKTWQLRYEPQLSHQQERVLARARTDGITGMFHGSHVRALAFSPDDSKLAAAHNTVRIWNLLAPQEKCRTSTIKAPVTSLVWSRSGERVLICDQESRSLYWWPKVERKTPRVHGLGTLLVRSGDNPLVVAGGEVLDAESLQVVHSFARRNDVRTISAQIFQPRNLLVTGDIVINSKLGAADELVTVWDLNSGRPQTVLRDRFGQVGNIAISPNGMHMAYGAGIRQTGYMREKSTGDFDIRLCHIGDEQ